MNGERLREARQRAGLTQTDLGRQVGLSQSMIGALERNQRTASRAIEQALAVALGLPRDSLSDPIVPDIDSPEALLADPHTPAGLRKLARDPHLALSLDIQPAEWRALHSLVPPRPLSRDGYVALLMTMRILCRNP